MSNCVCLEPIIYTSFDNFTHACVTRDIFHVCFADDSPDDSSDDITDDSNDDSTDDSNDDSTDDSSIPSWTDGGGR